MLSLTRSRRSPSDRWLWRRVIRILCGRERVNLLFAATFPSDKESTIHGRREDLEVDGTEKISRIGRRETTREIRTSCWHACWATLTAAADMRVLSDP